MQEGPLDMRMDNSSEEITAGEILNNYKTEELANIFYNYGQEPKSRILAVEIAKYRLKKPFTSTTQFKDFIMEAIYGNYTRKMTAVKRVFQALRIYINDELKDLDRVLLNLVNILPEKGRMAVISFHSLEDRITKHTFKELISSPNQSSIIKLVNKKPIIPSLEELKLNSRAESSKLRVIETVSLRKAWIVNRES